MVFIQRISKKSGCGNKEAKLPMNKSCPSCNGPMNKQSKLCRRCVKHPGRSDLAAALHAICQLINQKLLEPHLGVAAAELAQAIADRDWEWVEKNGPYYMEGLGLGDWDADTIKREGLRCFHA